MNYVKLPLNFFDSDKLKAIRSQKDGDSVILLYVMLITVAVKSNASGRLMLCDEIAYDEKIMASILNLPLAVVKNGLELLIKFGLLAVENNIFSLVNYDEFADIKATKERKQNAERQAKFKAKQTGSSVNLTVINDAIETEISTPKKSPKPTIIKEK